MESFSPIGSYELQVEGRLLVSTQSGPFNLAYSQEYAGKAGRLARQLNDSGPYIVLTVFRGSMLYATDALEFTYGRARMDEPALRRCVAHAIVAGPDVQGRETMRPWVEKYFQERGLTSTTGRLFSDESEARRWLTQALEAASATK
jgi:hypothetical protein